MNSPITLADALRALADEIEAHEKTKQRLYAMEEKECLARQDFQVVYGGWLDKHNKFIPQSPCIHLADEDE